MPLKENFKQGDDLDDKFQTFHLLIRHIVADFSGKYPTVEGKETNISSSILV